MPNDYGPEHRRLRKQWAQRIANKRNVPCFRCGWPILPEQQWHLDHTDDGTGYGGPSHKDCNLSAAGKKAQGLRKRHPIVHTNTSSRDW